MIKDLRKVVVLLAHPNFKDSQANKALTDTVKLLEGVSIFNLYDLEGPAFEVNEWTQIISDASAVVFQFPFYWAMAPSMLKKWQDEVFTYLARTPAVAGKPLLIVTTTGSEGEAYRSGGRNRFSVDELLRPYQLCAIHSGMTWQTPIVLHGMGSAEAPRLIAEGSTLYKQRIEALVANSHTNDNW